MILHIILFIWLVLGCLSFVLPSRFFSHFRYATIIAALLIIMSAIFYVKLISITFEITLLPENLTFLFQLDELSRFFVLLLGLSTVAISGFGQAYFRHFSLKHQRVIHIAYPFFVLGMLMVLSASNTFTFLFAWEIMSLSSYFLVVCGNTAKVVRQAGFLYLGIAHIGFLCISSAFFLLNHSDFALPLANLVFTLMLIGFGAKAGLFPLHIWLPEAHPAAPSPISALMSGVMLKTAIYGLIRFSFYWLLPWQQSWWGFLFIAIGLLSMLIGVLHAALQSDMKRLLAYSSIENLGFIVLNLGFAIVFYQYQQYTLSNVALLIVLLHSLSHSLFKSLLFLCTGSILHATGERNIGKLGGLIQKMPWVSACALTGCLAMAGLPLFSGFISEWLYLQLFFKQQTFEHFNFAVLSIVIAATSMLVFALAGFVAVKFFGIAFLGQPRESQLIHAKPANLLERVSLLWLTIWTIVIGLYPAPFISMIQKVINSISDKFTLVWKGSFTISFPHSTLANSNYFAPLLLAFIMILSLLLIFPLIHKHFRRDATWGCGFDSINSRMQDSAEGFSQPFKQIFSKLIQVKINISNINGDKPHYFVYISEKIWPFFYKPITQAIWKIVFITRWIQQGKISVYLTYVGLTLLVLLILVLWI